MFVYIYILPFLFFSFIIACNISFVIFDGSLSDVLYIFIYLYIQFNMFLFDYIIIIVFIYFHILINI